MNKTIFGILIVLIMSCKTNKEVMYTATIDERMLDTLTVTAYNGPEFQLPVYNPAFERTIDLLHTELHLSFDWQRQAVLGVAHLTLTPIFYNQDTVLLDAVGFDIEEVLVSNQKVSYEYDGYQLKIAQSLRKQDTCTLTIKYTAFPEKNDIDGSSAITSNKGLFFIDPLDEDPNKPSQIWTQGETEHNSRWFPTIDKPNERTTQNMYITVDTTYVTLSNGQFKGSTYDIPGKRTDRWQMDAPHAPYLFMLAVGQFAVVSETWANSDTSSIPIDYYVEPNYKPYAKEIFNHTSEMLTFFSEMLDYTYPWPKYSQIVTRDYVSGAMENTTAVIFGEFVQKTDRELIDNDNDQIVAHEMFHHWFGDLVTCESWANLTLNEGFANYAEYLWYEHKYGADRAEAHRLRERETYFSVANQSGIHPLIHYSYGDKEDMFDVHSYNKGGLVLHMLRDYLGDAAFFAALNKYLVDNAYSAVEVDELRMAFEDVTGKDLHWFFDQWFEAAGHPVLEVSFGQNLPQNLYSIVVSQVQDPNESLPIYILPLDVAVYDTNGNKHLYQFEMTKRDELFLLELDFPVAYAVIDDGSTVLAEIIEEKSTEEYVAQAKMEKNYIHRMKALQAIKGSFEFYEMISSLLKEDYYTLRKLAVEYMDLNQQSNIETLVKMATTDKHSAVRGAAITRLANSNYEGIQPLLTQVIESEKAYPVLEKALSAIYKKDREAGEVLVASFTEEEASKMAGTIAGIYATSGDSTYLSYFENHLSSISMFDMFNFYNQYQKLLEQQSDQAILIGAKKLSMVSKKGSSPFRKYAATSTINQLKQTIIRRVEQAEDTVEKDEHNQTVNVLIDLIADIKNNEKNENLLSRYQSF